MVDWSEHIRTVVQRFWGFSELRPLQDQAIRAGIEQRDSLVVMPTGGGKSLCYQVPPAVVERTDIVVSPLISLMKDQVDGLRESGYPAAALHSGMALDQVRETERRFLAGELRLLFVAPERLLTPRFLHILSRIDVRAFAIDEAHCISHWGHDFRPEYRQLAQLKDRFPRASMHAYTATATERVRADIVQQLGLRDPAILVGIFDRPNLAYRVVPRVDAARQTLEIIRRHSKRAVIVYCITRKETEAMAEWLRANGVGAAHYHAGMEAELRRKTQEAFANEELDVVAATVAFGMGIDRSDVRCVVHAAMPKSIEHYQQETGRAGRDGLPAECVLLYSAADVIRWESVLNRRDGDAEATAEMQAATRTLLSHMRHFASAIACRHRMLSEYFGQAYIQASCDACDVCLDEVEGVTDATVIAQKILSCVARAEQRFGTEHIADVLLGADTERVRRWHHEALSTYGLLQGTVRKELVNLIYQLVDAGLLQRTEDERPVLRLTDESWDVLRGKRSVRLQQVAKAPVKTTKAAVESWEGVDPGLFESLRQLRRRMADERHVPPYVLFSDGTLQEIARVRPGSEATLLNIRGIGQVKLETLGPEVLQHVRDYCEANHLALEAAVGTRPRRERAKETKPVGLSASKQIAFGMFGRGASLADVAAAAERSATTVSEYLEEFLATHPDLSIDAWVDAATQAKVSAAIEQVGYTRLRPIFEHLNGSVPYEQIRIVVACQRG